MQTIEQQFENFLKLGGLNKPDIPLFQYTEMKKAFYFGFAFCLKEMREGGEGMTEEQAIQQFEKWHMELNVYFKEIKKPEQNV